MKRRTTPSKGSSPINTRQRQLADEEARLKKQVADLQREIEEAPQRRQQQLRVQRDELLRSYEQRRGTDFFSSIPDKRHTLNAHTAALPRRRRKGEQKAAQLQFLALIVILILAFFFALKAIPW